LQISAFRRHAISTAAALLAAAFMASSAAQTDSPSTPRTPQWSTESDHTDMQRQLGIRQLRPGPSGRADAENPANYDEALANPWPQWPPLLQLDNGAPVTDAALWWRQRRPEIVEHFEREVIGRVPEDVPEVEWSISESSAAEIAGVRVIGERLTGHVDNSLAPEIDVDIDMSLVLPARRNRPVPIMIMFRRSTLRQALGLDAAPRFGRPEADRGRDPPATEQLIAAGWGYALLDPTSAQADNGAGLTRGIIGLANRGNPRSPEDWGALRAWSWAAARALDRFETDSRIDATRVGIEGVSRYGKAALVTLAFEPRFALALIGSSGEGGVSPYRRNFGEMVENLTGSGEYHWMAGNFLKYGTEESRFGRMDADDLPVDSHSLIALAAPRPTFISYGIPERGDALWLDQQGSYMAGVAAGEVFRLLDARDFGTGEQYRTARMPPVNSGLLQGTLAWRQHDGGHTDEPNWRYFIAWAQRELGLDNLNSGEKPAPAIARRRTDINSETAHAELLKKAQTGVIDVYFIGDSITRRWGALDYPELLEHWTDTFFGWNAANFAWGGDRTQNILWRLENGELEGVEPRVFVIQAGTNNLPDFEDPNRAINEVTDGIAAIVEACRLHAANAEIVLTGLFPRNDLPGAIPLVRAINERLREIAQHENLSYIDIGERLADRTGRLNASVTTDGLHLSLDGYRVWADSLSTTLAAILGPRSDRDEAPPATGNPAVIK